MRGEYGSPRGSYANQLVHNSSDSNRHHMVLYLWVAQWRLLAFDEYYRLDTFAFF
jgi:hypothetical protein